MTIASHLNQFYPIPTTILLLRDHLLRVITWVLGDSQHCRGLTLLRAADKWMGKHSLCSHRFSGKALECVWGGERCSTNPTQQPSDIRAMAAAQCQVLWCWSRGRNAHTEHQRSQFTPSSNNQRRQTSLARVIHCPERITPPHSTIRPDSDAQRPSLVSTVQEGDHDLYTNPPHFKQPSFLSGFKEETCLFYINAVSTSAKERSLGNILLKTGSVFKYLRNSA